jgi:hypothetical protein
MRYLRVGTNRKQTPIATFEGMLFVLFDRILRARQRSAAQRSRERKQSKFDYPKIT